MKLTRPKRRQIVESNPKVNQLEEDLRTVLKLLEMKDLPDRVVQEINQSMDSLNEVSDNIKPIKKALKDTRESVLTIVENELEIVPVNHYRKRWLSRGGLGMGLIIGVVIGLISGNMIFIIVGIPIGMAIGYYIGVNLDKRAELENRQL